VTATLETALERVTVTVGRARRSLASLRCERGYRELDSDRVRICPMDTSTTWSRVSGRGDGAVYELEMEVGS